MHAAIDDLEAESKVRILGLPAVEPRVRGHLEAALFPRPALRLSAEGAADPAAPVGGLDVPALDEAAGTRRIAAVGMGAKADLDEADAQAAFFGDEGHERQRRGRSSGDDGFGFAAKRRPIGVGPKPGAHLRQSLDVAWSGLPYEHAAVSYINPRAAVKQRMRPRVID